MAATRAPHWPSSAVQAVSTGLRIGGNHDAISRSTLMNTIASPMPTKIRAATAPAYAVVTAKPSWATVISTAPVNSSRCGPYRSISTPTGICMPAYTSSCSTVNVDSCDAEISNRSVAASPATPSDDRWKIARK